MDFPHAPQYALHADILRLLEEECVQLINVIWRKVRPPGEVIIYRLQYFIDGYVAISIEIYVLELARDTLFCKAITSVPNARDRLHLHLATLYGGRI